MNKMKEAIKTGKVDEEIKRSPYREVFSSLSEKEGCLLRKDKILIPLKL